MNYRDMNEGWWPLLFIINVLQYDDYIPLPSCVPTIHRFAMIMEDTSARGI